jgi:hypothetical protein
MLYGSWIDRKFQRSRIRFSGPYHVLPWQAMITLPRIGNWASSLNPNSYTKNLALIRAQRKVHAG